MKNIEKLFVNVNYDLTKILKTINSAKDYNLPTGLCLVVDSKNKLLGTITEGDIRRHILIVNSLKGTAKEIMKSRGMKKGEFINDIKDKKIQEKVRKEINESTKKMVKKFNDLQKQKYGKYHKELKDCEVKHCGHESNTMKKLLKNKSKTNVFAKDLYKSIK